MEHYTKIDDHASVQMGAILRRKNNSKDQQGRIIKPTDENDGWILAEVLDMQAGEFLTEVGAIRVESGDEVFVAEHTFADDDSSKQALEILTGWTLYRENPALQNDMLEFLHTSFMPAQILEWKRKDDLKRLFVPIQQRFLIGRFQEKIDYNKVRDERFREQLATLSDGKHMTYVAFIPRDTIHQAMFYSIGTKPHLETKKNIEREPFAFRPNHGGHIMCTVDEEGQSTILVDAGSNDLGAGMHTSLAIAEMVAEGLKSLFPEFEYRPLAGRGAFGLQQSY